MAFIGMRYAVAAPVSSHTDGSAINYGAGYVIGTAVEANVNFDSNDNPDYGDDIMLDNDKSITGYSGTLDVNSLSAAVRAKLLGWLPNATTATAYAVSDDNPPETGWGFMQVGMFKGVKHYDVYWFHKSRFSLTNIRALTKARQIDWNHPQMNFTGEGAYIDSSGKAKFFDWMTFDSESSAKSWLNSRAGIS